MPPKKVSGAKPQTSHSSTSSVKTGYLILYNSLSALAWAVVLSRTVSIAAMQGPRNVYLGVGQWTKWTQSFAALEILHSLFGIVRAPLMTTTIQVFSRLILVWGVVDQFPHLALQSPFYTSMLFAWSLTEVIRYSFFARGLAAGSQPYALTWLRYNTFFVLYPIGIGSECVMMWIATTPAEKVNELYKWALYAVLLVYVPGSYVLYTYMMSQRRKVMRALRGKNEKANQ